MWNDGYSKEQPWLNYFNSYERMHCCFEGDPDGEEGGGDDDVRSGGTGSGTIGSTPEGGPPGLSSLKVNIKDQPHNLAWINKEEQSLLKDLGGSGRPGPMGIPAYDDDDYDTDIDEDYDFDQEDISGGMGGDTGGGTGGGDSWGEPDDPNPEDFSWSASKGFTAPSVTSATTADDLETIGVDNITDLGTMNEMYNNPDAYGMGYNDFVDMGYFDKAEAADYEREKAAAAALQASYRDKGKDVTISVDKDGLYSYTGKDAFSVGYSEMGKGAELLGQNFGIGSVVDGLNRAFGTTEEEVASSYGQGDPGANFSDFQSTSSQNGDEDGEDETFGEDETDEGVDDTDTDTDTETSTTESEEEEAAPETAMEAYFRKLGIASPALTVSSTSPSYFQGYPSYLPPTGPAANAAYRRKLALRTPRYQEPSGTNPSIATYAAAYGIPYTEAAKKFAPPSVPAMGGGGLRSLMEYS